MINKRCKSAIAIILALLSMGTPLANANSLNLTRDQKSIYASEMKNINLKSKDDIQLFINEKIDEGIKFEENKDLTQEEIDKRFNDISNNYKMYEPFSAVDEEFVLFYSMNSSNARYNKPGQPISFTNKHSQYGLNATYNATVNLEHTSPLVYNFKYSLKGYIDVPESHVGSKQAHLRCEVFGIIGSGGIGRVYNKTINSAVGTSPGKTNFNIYDTTGVMVGFIGAHLYPTATVSTKNGSTFTMPQ